MSAPPLVCTVSTVKENRTGLERFLARNLRAGADHMFVFVDDDPDGALPLLQHHPHVTTVVTDDRYWSGDRPKELIHRQLVNANLANALASLVPGFGWLAHIDADECLDVDRGALSVLAEDVRAVRLAVLEAVSTEDGPVEPELFKRKLQQEQLDDLFQRGLISSPDNRSYLFGHLIGKSIVRPGLDLDMGIHRATWKSGEQVDHHRSQSFRVLHYDSVSADAFARKWVAHVEGGATKFRKERQAVLQAVRDTLADRSLDDATRQSHYLDIYRRHIADPVDELDRLGVLVRPSRSRHCHTARRLPYRARRDLQTLATLLSRLPKSMFRPGQPAAPLLMAMMARHGRLPHRPRVRSALQRALDAWS